MMALDAAGVPPRVTVCGRVRVLREVLRCADALTVDLFSGEVCG